ncbi:energy transducer TonB [Cesiribacter sp. SM1]|uniref:energy transducer TonB n=1 Tax=Cesiribacter sp. SM1 TaxID=2861196 RepID=UPI001CD1C4D7|nr:hypothetical protein [Cesiribacter sp. SM1]
MNKPVIRNWMKYWASTLALSGMLVMGACDSEQKQGDEVATNTTETSGVEPLDREDVNRPLAEGEYDDEASATVNEADADATTATATTSDDATVGAQDNATVGAQDNASQAETTASTTAGSQWSGNRSGSSISNIDAHIDKFSEVNNAIEESLASLTAEEGGMQAGQNGSEGMYNTGAMGSNQDMGTSETMPETERVSNTEGLSSYDNMEPSGNAATTDESADNMADADMSTAPESAIVVYEVYSVPADQLSEEERLLMQDARTSLEATGNAKYIAASPDVNYSELVEEIEEEMTLPQELEDAKVEGTVLVQMEVNQQGEIESAEVIDGILRQKKDDGTVMTLMRLTDRAQNEVQEEIAKEDLIEFKGEDKERLVEALKQESLRAVNTTSGKWQSSGQEGEQPSTVTMIMPIRFDIDD